MLRMPRGGVLLALVILATLGSARAALACSCRQSGPACQAFWKTELVFDAVVRSVDQEGFSTTLDVGHVWKGKVPATVKVPSAEGAGVGCIYEFTAGKRYLVFGYRDPDDGQIKVSLCSATTEWDGLGADAEFLASLSRPASGGRIFGTVEHFTRAGGGVPQKDTVPIATSVHLLTADGVRTMTSRGGEYSFDGLRPGAYGLSIDTPEGYVAYQASRRVEIPNGRACSSESFSFTDNGRIAGRILNSKGNPPSGLNIEVLTAGNMPVPSGVNPRTAMVRDDGSFEADELPPGDYVVGVNLIDMPNPGVPYPRLLYPGRTSPGTVTVRAGERVDLGTWQLPGPAPSWVVSGVVAWEDGRPAAGIEIRAFDMTTGRESGFPAGQTSTGQDGGFALVLWQGHRYRFVVRSTQVELMLVAAPSLQIGERPPLPLRIVIRAPK